MRPLRYLVCTAAFAAIATTGFAQPREPAKFPAPGSPTIYKSGTDLDAALKQSIAKKTPLPLGPVLVSDRTSFNIVQRQSANGPIAHKGWSEVHYIIAGTGVLEIGGPVKPGTEGENAVVVGATEKKVKPGDIAIVPGGSLHHYKQLDGPITYYEIRFPDVAGPAPQASARKAPPAPVAGSPGIFISGDDLRAAVDKTAKANSGEAITPVIITDRFSINQVMRSKPAAALAHPGWNEMQYVLTGSGAMTTGGAVTGSGEARAIQGGVTQALKPGDVMIVPDGTPHQWSVVGPVTYLEVRFPDAPPAAR
jgi:mannose-6-phosphate isomerase-like protein (cupin superfamily)